jgi:hypothetical protein
MMFNNLNKYRRPISLEALHDGVGVVIGVRSMTRLSSSEIPLIHGTQIVTCPKCNATFEFRRSIRPHIDECGFESYELKCVTCSASLYGIIDPADDELLLSETEPQN